MGKKQLIILASLLLILVAVTTYATLRTTQVTEPVSTQAPLPSPAPKNALEGNTSVRLETLAAKVDFARKVVSVTDPSHITALKQTLESIGGTLVSQAGSTAVIVLPKDNLAKHEQDVAKSAGVSTVETDYPVAVLADSIDWGVNRVYAPRVWDRTTGANVKVAVLDTGIDATHPDLAGTVDNSFDFVKDTAGGTDIYGHGTHVAGVIAAAKNDTGIIGESYEARLLSAKVLADDGTGYVSDIVEGLTWAQQQGARVINLSLGTTYDSRLLREAITNAVNAGIVVVAAAGNTNGGAMTYPAAYSSVISVGATDKSDRLASFSAIGATVVAPGVTITSTLPGSRYAAWSGTSMAAPHVAAAAALLIAEGATNIRTTLTESATSVNGLKLIDLQTAVSGTDTLAPLISVTNPINNATVSGTVPFSATATDENGVRTVSFSIDGTTVKEFSAGPYEHALNAASLTDGTHTFYVTATDIANNSGTVQVGFMVSNGVASTPTATPTPTAAKNKGQEVRQSNGNRNQEAKPNAAEPTLPVGTNAGERSQKPEPTAENVEQSEPADSSPSTKKAQPQSKIRRIFQMIFG